MMMAAERPYLSLVNTKPNHGDGARPPVSLDRTVRDMQKSITALVESVVKSNLHAMDELIRVKTAEDFRELHQRSVRAYLEALVNGSMTFMRTI